MPSLLVNYHFSSLACRSILYAKLLYPVPIVLLLYFPFAIVLQIVSIHISVSCCRVRYGHLSTHHVASLNAGLLSTSLSYIVLNKNGLARGCDCTPVPSSVQKNCPLWGPCTFLAYLTTLGLWEPSSPWFCKLPSLPFWATNVCPILKYLHNPHIPVLSSEQTNPCPPSDILLVFLPLPLFFTSQPPY